MTIAFCQVLVWIDTLFLCGRIGRVLVGWKETMNLSYLIWKNEIVYLPFFLFWTHPLI